MSYSVPSDLLADQERVRIAREAIPRIMRALAKDDWRSIETFADTLPRHDHSLMKCWNIIALTSAAEGGLETWVAAIERMVPDSIPVDSPFKISMLFTEEGPGGPGSFEHAVRTIGIITRGYLPKTIVIRLYRSLSRLLVLYAITGSLSIAVARNESAQSDSAAFYDVATRSIGTVMIILTEVLALFLRAPKQCLPIWEEEKVIDPLVAFMASHFADVQQRVQSGQKMEHDMMLQPAADNMAVICLVYGKDVPLPMQPYIKTIGPYTLSSLPREQRMRHQIGLGLAQSRFRCEGIVNSNACGNCGRIVKHQKELQRCSACKMQLLCSKACQVQMWKQKGHKKGCSKLWLKHSSSLGSSAV